MSDTGITGQPEVAAAVGAGPILNPDQASLLEILLDPRNDPWERAQDYQDRLEEFAGYTGLPRLREPHRR